MSDDAQTPEAPDTPDAPGVPGEAAAGGSAAPDEKLSLGKPGAASLSGTAGRGGVGPGGPEPRPEPDPWAPPVAGAGAQVPSAVSGGPGHTLVSHEPPAWPAPSVHDQQTVTSLPPMGVPPGTRDAVPAPPPWVNPSAGPGTAPPSDGAPANPFAPPGPFPQPGSPVNPFAPPAAAGRPYAAHDELVPPPPIAPDGPGQVPYGYPGGHGHPPGPSAAGYYGWPGVQAMPSNGLGTAGLVLGIISAVVFCLWPVAIILGVLALIFGTIGRGKARRGEATNAGQALAGIICGAAGVVLGLAMLAFLIATS